MPEEGFTFVDSMHIPPLQPGNEGKEERLKGWKESLEAFVVGYSEQHGGSDFSLACYAGMALENLSSSRDETSTELFSWANFTL